MAKTITYSTLSAPANPVATLASGGSLDANTTYYYMIFAVFCNTGVADAYAAELGRSLCSVEVNATTDTTNKKIVLTWDAVTGAGAYRIYRCKGESIATTTTKMNTTLAACPTTNTYTDDGTAAQQLCHTSFRNDIEGRIVLDGGTSSDPITMNDIYAADVAGSWGKIVKLTARCYSLNVSYIHINASTYVKFSGNLIILLNSQIAPANNTSSYLQIGERSDAYDATYDGCVVSFKCANAGYYSTVPRYLTKIYDSTFIYDKSFPGFPLTTNNSYGNFTFLTDAYCQDVIFKEFRSVSAGSNSTMKEIRIIDGSENAWNWVTTGLVRNLQVEDTGTAIQYSVGSNCSINGYTIKKGGRIRMYSSGNIIISLQNSLVDNTKFEWVYSPLTTVKEYFDYKPYIKDENGNAIASANITVTDINGDTIFSDTTDANGTIITQSINTRKFNYGNAVADPNNLTTSTLTITTVYSPFIIKVSKIGYETYIDKITINSKEINKVITLKTATPLMIDNKGKKYLRMNKSNQGNNRNLVVGV